MSIAEIIEELPKLSLEERDRVRSTLDRLEEEVDDGWEKDCGLTREQKKLIEQRFAEHDADPGSSLTWEEFKARRLDRKLK